MKSVCPWKPENGLDEWLEFERPTYTNEELISSAHKVPRFVNNAADDIKEEIDF